LIVATVGLLALLPMQALAGMTPEEVKLFEETKARAAIGDANAQYHVGVCYAAGRGTAKDFGEAAKWYRKGAEQGNASAQLFLGMAYASGQGTKKDDVEAAKWWRKAAIQGNDAAQFNLGGSYYAGRGVPKDQNEAYAYLWLSGRTDEVARKTFATFEKGMTPDVKLRLQKRADELQKEIDANVAAQSTSQPKKTISGMSTEAVKAFEETKAKAEKGDLKAHFDLAACYARGWGVAQDQAEAVKWVRKAADKGYPMAQFSLGNCYDNGNGVTKNAIEAAKWMRKAADQGFAKAQNTLASYYTNGKGVAMSQVEATKWWRKAA
jgi:hypothetical protein